MSPADPCHILIFQPRLAGHHLTWLRYISQDLQDKDYRLTLAIDGRPQNLGRYDDLLAGLKAPVRIISVYDDGGRLNGGTRLAALAAAMHQSGADHAFLDNFDDIASGMLRRAAVGIYPPALLKGRLSVVYFRPRFLSNPCWPPGNLLKRRGFRRLADNGWFFHLFLMDEYLCRANADRFPAASLHFLPDPWSGDFSTETSAARKQLSIPEDRHVFLHYGLGARRKGLHLAVAAMNRQPGSKWHLLCAGNLKSDQRLLTDLNRLEGAGRATLLDRYVSDSEQQACFCAADAVLLPYINHFGSSGVLSLAAAAGKIVIASDSGLLARRVHDHDLGICFASGSSQALAQAMTQVETMSAHQRQGYVARAKSYAGQCDRQAFRQALHAIPFQHEQKRSY